MFLNSPTVSQKSKLTSILASLGSILLVSDRFLLFILVHMTLLSYGIVSFLSVSLTFLKMECNCQRVEFILDGKNSYLKGEKLMCSYFKQLMHTIQFVCHYHFVTIATCFSHWKVANRSGLIEKLQAAATV